MRTLKIHRDTLSLRVGRKVVFTAPLNSRGDGDWGILHCTAPNTFRRYGTDTDLSALLQSEHISAVPVPFNKYPYYASIGSIYIFRQCDYTLYLIAPVKTGGRGYKLPSR